MPLKKEINNKKVEPTISKNNSQNHIEIDFSHSNFEMAHSIDLSDIISDFVFEQEDIGSNLGKNLNYMKILDLLYKYSDTFTYEQEVSYNEDVV